MFILFCSCLDLAFREGLEGIHSSRVGVRTPATAAATGGGGFKAGDSRLRADGDADIDDAADLSGFDVPVCIRCGGVLKVLAVALKSSRAIVLLSLDRLLDPCPPPPLLDLSLVFVDEHIQ